MEESRLHRRRVTTTMSSNDSGPVSRRRATCHNETGATTVGLRAIDQDDNEDDVAHAIGRSGGVMGLLFGNGRSAKRGPARSVSQTLERLRLHLVRDCLTPAATDSERRKRRIAFVKAGGLALYSIFLLVVGTMRGGGGGGGLSSLGGIFTLGLAAQTPRRSGRPRTVSKFDDGGASYIDTARSLLDRDGRLVPLDRSAFGSSYGGLKIRRLSFFEEGRTLDPPDPNDAIADDPLPLRPRLWTDDPYDMYDDDGVRASVFRLKNRETRRCERAPWHKLHKPTCNDFHSVDMLGGVMLNDVRYLGRGHFRQAFAINGHHVHPDATLKVLRWRSGEKDDYPDRIEMTRRDALVMERLTSSPRITNVHGHCATSIVVESLPGEIWEHVVPTPRVVQRKDVHDLVSVDNKNKMIPDEKLRLALYISEALAELHGFKDGVIVHDDIDLGQFLRTPDGRVKLNDFNRAKPMLWDSVEQKYCKYYNGHIGGKMRSPEEFTEPPSILNEKIDIYSMGNNMYGILTGLWPFYLEEDEVAQRLMVKGKRPFIDKRWIEHSFAEKKLVEAIERCWIHDPEKRVDIFWLVKFLREAVAENENIGEEGGGAQS